MPKVRIRRSDSSRASLSFDILKLALLEVSLPCLCLPENFQRLLIASTRDPSIAYESFHEIVPLVPARHSDVSPLYRALPRHRLLSARGWRRRSKFWTRGNARGLNHVARVSLKFNPRGKNIMWEKRVVTSYVFHLSMYLVGPLPNQHLHAVHPTQVERHDLHHLSHGSGTYRMARFRVI